MFPAGDDAEPLPESAAPAADFGTESRRERHRRETFERLVRAARAIMFSRGFNDITVQDITEAADVGKGTFFNYFRSKEHIVTRVQEYNRRGLLVALDRVRSGDQTPQAALTDVITWLMCPTGGDWLTYQSNTMRALALHAEVRAYFSPELRSNLNVYTQIMEVAQQQGNVRTDIPAAELASVTQTFLAGTTVLFWIHGVVPTPAIVADLCSKFFKTLEVGAMPAATAAPKAKRPARAARSTRKPATARSSAASARASAATPRASAGTRRRASTRRR